jgi:cytoskeletal protein RodZ
MSDSIGKKLKDARIGRGSSVSDVCHATRITEAQILGLEADDYSVFPSVAYARSFLGLYSTFLGVDARGEIEAMAKPGITAFRGAPLAPKMSMEPQDSIIPIVKGLPEYRPRQVKSILVPLLFVTALLLLPTAFLLGRRLGQAEAQSAPDSPLEEVAGLPGATASTSPVPKDPIQQRQPSDGSLPSAPLRPPVPNPELDALLSDAPPRP